MMIYKTRQPEYENATVAITINLILAKAKK